MLKSIAKTKTNEQLFRVLSCLGGSISTKTKDEFNILPCSERGEQLKELDDKPKLL